MLLLAFLVWFMDGWMEERMGLYGVLGGRRGRVSLVFYVLYRWYIYLRVYLLVGVPGSGFYCYCKEIIRILKQLSE